MFNQLYKINIRSISFLSFFLFILISGLTTGVANAAEMFAENQQQIATLTVNINKASAEELSDVMTGIGLRKATVIVEYREKNGSFKTLEDLLEVRGIGVVTLEKNRHKLEL